MSLSRSYLTAFLTGSLLLAAAIAVAQNTPAPSSSPAAVSQNGASAAAGHDASPSATPAAAARVASATPLPPPSASSRLLLANADRLVDLAQQLKAEMDKTNQYVLSLNTIRRAEDVEKLAKELQKQLQHAKK
jgi:predicted phage gp36 major capsid-like protein